MTFIKSLFLLSFFQLYYYIFIFKFFYLIIIDIVIYNRKVLIF
uniref:Uncharacterized protein n=1 Tax=Mammaliicoccus phage MSShimriz1 TaxID=3230127 RepID=A0AAU8GUR6_9VIRU